jgi:hypothetical protein
MPDISKTRVDLIERAASELGVLPSGQQLSDEDSATIGALLDPLLLQLSLDGVVGVADANAIPSEYFLPLARLLANEASPSFGIAYSRDAKLENEHQLRRLTAMRPTREQLKTIFY